MLQGDITIPKRWLAGAVALVGAGLMAVACSSTSAITEPGRDASVSGQQSGPALEFQMPDGFGNGATKCLVPGIRVATLFHSHSAYGSIALVADPRCK